mmetsp:Transcript_53224/g.59480  ORF Transcript_53224/g.59480 Transcript_53224/m.59480 type:complete len:517 (+) Transcript_53224:61-1611(+)
MSNLDATAEEKVALKAARKAARKVARKAARKAERKIVKQKDKGSKRKATQQDPSLTKKGKSASDVKENCDVDDGDGDKNNDNKAYITLHEIVIHEKNAPPPCRSLRNAPFPSPLVKVLESQGFNEPSPVQAVVWPLAVSGRDVLAIAKTGSGKTLGFLLPILAKCIVQKKAANGGPIGMIMAPTRELALQIHAVAVKFGSCINCRSVAVYGGAAREKQVRALQQGCELIIGTPGRIKDVLDTRGGGRDAVCDVSHMRQLALDEADRMLDMGFEADIRAIVWQCFGNHEHQTYLFSATWPLGIQDIANDLLTNSVKVTVGAGGSKLTASKSVTQRVHVITQSQRMDTFEDLIHPFRPGFRHAGKRVIVFANMKHIVKKLTQYCVRKGLSCESLSGDRSQSQRESTVRKFKDGRVTVVVATDVAARGLDIKGIERVINYELPLTDFQDYVHRIGRTGRAGATGEADSLFTESDRKYSTELIRIMKEAGQEVPTLLEKFAPKKTVFEYDSDDFFNPSNM